MLLRAYNMAHAYASANYDVSVVSSLRRECSAGSATGYLRG